MYAVKCLTEKGFMASRGVYVRIAGLRVRSSPAPLAGQVKRRIQRIGDASRCFSVISIRSIFPLLYLLQVNAARTVSHFAGFRCCQGNRPGSFRRGYLA